MCVFYCSVAGPGGCCTLNNPHFSIVYIGQIICMFVNFIFLFSFMFSFQVTCKYCFSESLSTDCTHTRIL